MMRYGVRPGEVRALQHADINHKMGIITIQRAFSEKVLCSVTKTKKNRELPLFKDIKEMLQHLPRAIEQPFVFLFNGAPYNNNTLGDIWRATCKKIGLSGCNLYQATRHSAASQLANSGVPLQTIALLLGHSTIKMTEQYTHVSVDTLRKVMEDNVLTLRIANTAPLRHQNEEGKPI
jgi:integrase